MELLRFCYGFATGCYGLLRVQNAVFYEVFDTCIFLVATGCYCFATGMLFCEVEPKLKKLCELQRINKTICTESNEARWNTNDYIRL